VVRAISECVVLVTQDDELVVQPFVTLVGRRIVFSEAGAVRAEIRPRVGDDGERDLSLSLDYVSRIFLEITRMRDSQAPVTSAKSGRPEVLNRPECFTRF
jgi:hypothetical protein